MRSATTIGLVLLGIWLIVTAIVALIDTSVPGLGLILNLLALAAGFFLLLGQGRSRLRGPGDLGLVILAIWLILTALVSLLGLSLPGLELVLNILALAAGVLLLFGRAGRRGTVGPTTFGLLLLGVWLIISSLLSLLSVSLPGVGLILALLALVAGVLLLVGR